MNIQNLDGYAVIKDISDYTPLAMYARYILQNAAGEYFLFSYDPYARISMMGKLSEQDVADFLRTSRLSA